MKKEVRWRATGTYSPANASKAGLLEETRRALELYGELGDTSHVRQALLDGALPQRSRYTRRTIAGFIQRRLFGWHPPAWALPDLVDAARSNDDATLQALLLLHAARQDGLLYDVVQKLVLPRWRDGQIELRREDVQRFLDQSAAAHPEIDGWTHATRQKLAGNLLTILRDYGLLRGAATKQIVEPAVPDAAVQHLLHLLREEGVPDEEIPHHPDWNLWLWTPQRVRAAMSQKAVSR